MLSFVYDYSLLGIDLFGGIMTVEEICKPASITSKQCATHSIQENCDYYINEDPYGNMIPMLTLESRAKIDAACAAMGNTRPRLYFYVYFIICVLYYLNLIVA